MKKRYNPNLAKIHRNYTVRELADVYGVGVNTVGQWIKKGMQVCDGSRPILILGLHAGEFHRKNRIANKRPCLPGEIYCMGCQKAKSPAGGMADYQPKTPTGGAIVGICPDCSSMMYRRVSLAKLAVAKGNLDISIPLGESRMGDTSQSLVNHAFKEGANNHV